MNVKRRQKKEEIHSKKKSVKKRIKLRKIAITILFLIVILLPLALLNTQKGITGMVTAELNISQTFVESTVLNLSYANITSLKATGSSLEGTSRIYLQTVNESLLAIVENPSLTVSVF